MTEFDFSLDADVRRAEPDLWLSSRLVSSPEARAALIGLYAVHAELARVAGAVSNALAGEIRLAWWREEVEALSSSSTLGHPALNALKKGEPSLDPSMLDGMIEGRHAELEPRPFNDEAALLAYLDRVDGGLMRTAASLLSPDAVLGAAVARAWGWTRLLRERSAWRAKGRDWAPLSWGEASEEEITAHVRHRVADALKSARGEVAALPVAAFPALAYATLASSYARGRNPSDLEKRLRLIWASLRGRP
jgi:phytoene synthase